MAANETTAMTTNRCHPMPVLRHRVVVGWWRIAGPMWIHLLAWVGFAGATAFAQGIASTNAPEQFANSDCLACHLEPNTTRVVNGKTESLVFPTNDFQRSVHANLACVDCHMRARGPAHALPVRLAELARRVEVEHGRAGPRAGLRRRGQRAGRAGLAGQGLRAPARAAEVGFREHPVAERK